MTDMTAVGDFTYDPDARKLSGLLLPFGEASRTNSTGQTGVVFSADTIDLPRDPSVVTLNRHHDRHDPVGRATVLEKREVGVYAEFTLADTDEADDWLGRQKESLRKLSAEVRFAADRVRARLTGAALVTEGAFQSAGLFELAPDAEIEPEDVADPAHLAIEVDALPMPQDITVTTPEGDAVIYTPQDTPSEDNREEGEFSVNTSIVPDGVTTPEAEKIDTSASALFAALASNGASGDAAALTPFQGLDARNTGMFALADITATGTATTVQSQFVGDLWKGKQFTQRVLPLFNHADLTALKVEGWRWTTAPEVAAWAGDKAEVPSNAVAFGATAVTAERIAGAHDIDRALRDFGNESFWSGYFQAMTTSYAKVADAKVLARIIAAPNAGNGIGATVVTPGTVPSGVDAGIAAIVDGALAVIAAGYTPTFALVSTAIYRSLLLTPKDKVLEFLTSAMGLEEGSLSGFKIIPHATLAAKRVVVGSRDAATVYELPGSPIRVEGLDIAKGGIDPAVYGYIATVVNDVTGLASVTTV